MYGDLRVSYHLAMVEEFFFLPSAIVVGETRMQGGLKL